MARLVSVSVLDAEMEEFQRQLKRRCRRISETSDDDDRSQFDTYLAPPATAKTSVKCEAKSEKESCKGRVWGAELPSETRRSPAKRLAITPIPPERFYAADKGKHDAWQQHLELLRRPVGDTYEEFPRQELAFRFADERPGEGLHVFARERQKEEECGLRTYIVTTYKEFWTRYMQSEPAQRNYYEMIREGVCCNLYFDIEFLKAENPHIVSGGHEEAVMKAFVKFVGREVQLFFGLPFRVRRRHFVDLDSSDARKFSRHLVLRLPDNYVFANNQHCGHFVRMLHHKLVLLRQLHARAREREKKDAATAAAESSDGTDDRDGCSESIADVSEDHETLLPSSQDKSGLSNEMLDRFFVMNDKAKEVFIVDMGVYTRNRNFRLIYSTKAGKQLFLRPSAINRFVPPHHYHHHDAPSAGSSSAATVASAVVVPDVIVIKKEKSENEEEMEGAVEQTTSNSTPPMEMSFSWFVSSLVTRVGEAKETDVKRVYLLSCEPVPSEDGRDTLFYSHYLTPVTLPPNLTTGITSPATSGPHSCASSSSSYSSVPTLTFSPPPLTSSGYRLSAPTNFLPRVTPECSPNSDPRHSPLATSSSSSSSSLYSPLFTSPYQPALPFYAVPVGPSASLSRHSSSSSYPPPIPSSSYPAYTSSSSSSSSFGSGLPAIDDFIAGHVGGERPGRRGGFRSVRRWNNLIVYSITHNRFCENIGREHKSNHIMIVVDLRSGTFYQKCYDPDCQAVDYRSPEYSLPPEICPTVFSPQQAGPTKHHHHHHGTVDTARDASSSSEAREEGEGEDMDDDRFLSDEALYNCIVENPAMWP